MDLAYFLGDQPSVRAIAQLADKIIVIFQYISINYHFNMLKATSGQHEQLKTYKTYSKV